ncbi:BTAD domain-containing putative transcriptional regulator [Kibdelosporangium lantanae]
MTVEFRVLGEIEARRDGELVDLGHARQRCVLAVLLVEANHPVHVDQLVDRVWGERVPNSARESLYSYLSRLRQALTDATIVRRSGGYVLNVDPDSVDLHRFLRMVDQARETGDAALFDDALRLWDGEPFAGLNTPWLQTQRESLEQKRLAAELDRNDLELSQGVGRVAELTARYEQFPLDERLTGQLMLALQRAGRQSRALAVYDQTRRALADQLGIDPSPELTALRQQILTNSAIPSARSDLPRDANQFTGRTLELRCLAEQMAGSVAAIDGMAGVGKTALVVRLAHQLVPRYPDGQIFLDLHAYTPGSSPLRPAAALDKLLRAVGVTAMPDDMEERAALWRTKIAGQRLLIVLDNAAETAQVRPLLPGTADCLVLVTSRQRLTGLDGAFVLSLDVLSPAEAEELFRRVIGTGRMDNAAVQEVLQLCGYLPLAIRLAAARLQHRPTWTVEHLARRLRDQRPLAELQAEDRSVGAAFSLSYQQLDYSHRRMFRLLGRVPGPDFDVHAAAALAATSLGEADRLLEGLLDAHLVQQPAADRYRLHDLLHAYAADLEDPEEHSALARLLAYYLRTASAAMDAMTPHERHRRPEIEPPTTAVPTFETYEQALAWLETERTNLLAATNVGDPRYTSRLSPTIWRYLYLRGYHDDALTLHSNAQQAAQETGERVLEGQAVYNLGTSFERLGRYKDAEAHLIEALAILQETGTRPLEGHVANSLGMLYSWRRDHDRAVAYYRQAAAIGHETGTSVLEGHALDNLGIVHAELGELDDAIALYQRALAIFAQIDTPYLQSAALDNLGAAFNELGRHTEAREHLEHALRLGQQAGNRDFQVEALNSLVANALSMGDPERAREYARQAVTISEETGMLIGQARGHANLGRALRALGDVETARYHWTRALAMYSELGVPEADDMRELLES